MTGTFETCLLSTRAPRFDVQGRTCRKRRVRVPLAARSAGRSDASEGPGARPDPDPRPSGPPRPATAPAGVRNETGPVTRRAHSPYAVLRRAALLIRRRGSPPSTRARSAAGLRGVTAAAAGPPRRALGTLGRRPRPDEAGRGRGPDRAVAPVLLLRQVSVRGRPVGLPPVHPVGARGDSHARALRRRRPRASTTSGGSEVRRNGVRKGDVVEGGPRRASALGRRD